MLFDKYMKKFGVETTFVSPVRTEEWSAALRPATRLFFLETPSNPVCEVADIAAIAAIAHDHEILLAVDNCFCTPALQRPLNLGADLVIHSATKYLAFGARPSRSGRVSIASSLPKPNGSMPSI